MRDVGGALFFVFAVVAAAATGVLAAMEPRLALVAVVLLLGLLVRARTALGLVLILVCSLGLVRRVTSGGRADTDPLLLVPIALLYLAILWSVGTRSEDGRRVRETALSLALKALALLPIAAWALSERSVPALYVALLYSTCFVAMGTAASGTLPDLSAAVSKAAPWATLAIGGYGLVQYQFLPSWDRAWMIASELNSIGAPLPGQVRVFGPLESPGPYSLVLGALMCVVAQGIVRRDGGRRLALRVLALAVATPPFFLTGVRTALISLAIVMLVAATKTRSLSLIAVAAAGGAALYVVGSRVIATATGSNVFTLDRYTDLADDQSLAARLELIRLAVPALTNPLGSGFGISVQRADNLYVDLLLAAGPIALVAMLMVAVIVTRRSVSGDWRSPQNSLHLAVLYSVPFTAGGAIFATTSGLVIALAWGWVLADKRSASMEPVTLLGSRSEKRAHPTGRSARGEAR